MKTVGSIRARGACIAAIIILLILRTTSVQAQVSVQLQQPPPNQLKVADLWRVTLINTTRQSYTVYLEGTAKEATAGQVVDAQSAAFVLGPGTKIVTGQMVSPIKVNSSNSRYKNILLQTGTVPAGDYTICVTVKTKDGEELGNDCIEQHVANASLVLIAPSDEATVEEDLPMFLWTSTPPLGSSATYALKLVELLGNQTPTAALQSNSAFYQQQSIHTTTLQYPISAPKLIPGRSYAWQITAYDNGAALSTSEAWSFIYKSADSAVPKKLKKKKEFLTAFEAIYGGAHYDHGWAIQNTKDSGYIIAGYTRSFGNGNDDALLIKLDAAGAVQWARTFGGENDDAFYCVTPASDGGYIAAGFTRSFDVGNDDMYVVKVSADGTPEYARALGGGGYDAAYGVTATLEDGAVVVGTIGKGDDYDAYAVLLDKGGHPIRGINFGVFECDVAHAVTKRSLGGYLVTGYTRSAGMGNDDISVCLLTRELQLEGAASYGGRLADRGEAIANLGNDKYVIAGYRPSDDMKDAGNIALLAINSTGPAFAAADYNAGSIDKGLSLDATPDQGVIVSGYTSGDSSKPGGIVIFKTNSTGGIEWSRSYADSKLNESFGVVRAHDGGYAIAGYSDAGAEGDVIVIKTDGKGAVGCTDRDGGVVQHGSDGGYQPMTSLQDYGCISRDLPLNSTNAPIKAQMLCPKPELGK